METTLLSIGGISMVEPLVRRRVDKLRSLLHRCVGCSTVLLLDRFQEIPFDRVYPASRNPISSALGFALTVALGGRILRWQLESPDSN